MGDKYDFDIGILGGAAAGLTVAAGGVTGAYQFTQRRATKAVSWSATPCFIFHGRPTTPSSPGARITASSWRVSA